MANRFWVGGTNTWNATAGTKWSTTSGGGGGSAVPTNADDVFFDGNSGAITVTLGANEPCKSITFTGFTGTFAGSSKLTVGDGTTGSATFASTMTLTFTGRLAFLGNCNLISGTKTILGILEINNAGKTVTLQDNCNCTASLEMTAGTFDANIYNIMLPSFNSGSTGSAKVLNMGTGTWTLTNNSAQWFPPDAAHYTINCGTSTVKFTGTSTTFASQGFTFYNIWNASSASDLTIFDNSTFNNIKSDPNTTLIILDTTTTTAVSLTLNGTSGHNVIFGDGFDAGTLSISSGTITVDYCTITGITATGGATFNATHSTNGGGNSGWNFISATSNGNMMLAM